MPPQTKLRELSAFWRYLGLHKRQCAHDGKSIISVFDSDCPYPVQHRETWLEHANPPSSDYNSNKKFWEQVWDLFQQCPIPHNTWANSENCEYTDDRRYGKNCYLCHNGLRCEDLKYAYRVLECKSSHYLVFSFNCERCYETTYCFRCYKMRYAIDCKDCSNCAFTYDCQNCEECIFSRNLRNKKYCIGNKQYSKEEYESKKVNMNFWSLKFYNNYKQKFLEYIKTHARRRANHNIQTENCIGDFLENCENCEHTFFIQESEDCKNVLRAYKIKSNTDSVGNFQAEKVLNSSLVQDGGHNISHCFNINTCKNMEYSQHCYHCEDCFACCGLVRKKYHIFNKEYSKEDYERIKAQIINDMKKQWIYGQFSPTYFMANTYEESAANIYFPLQIEEQQNLGYRIFKSEERSASGALDISEIPDTTDQADKNLTKKLFRDPIAKKPFQIHQFDIDFSKKNNVPLPNSFYTTKIKENHTQLYPNIELRTTKCANSGKEIQTTLPAELDARILDAEIFDQKLN